MASRSSLLFAGTCDVIVIAAAGTGENFSQERLQYVIRHIDGDVHNRAAPLDFLLQLPNSIIHASPPPPRFPRKRAARKSANSAHGGARGGCER
jgi:hypothetical protein